MSLILNIDTNPPVTALAWPNGPKKVTISMGKESVSLENKDEIGLEDFCELVKYVMTNVDLIPNDPRIRLLERLKNYKIIEGWNPSAKRIQI